MKEDELPFIPEHHDVASKATMVFSCLNKQIQSFPIHSTFLVGTVAGCELRLAGLDLPALLFQVNYVKPRGLLVRSITPLSGLTLNGSSFQESILKSNDKLNIGNYEFSFIVTDNFAAITPSENIALTINEQSATVNKIKTKSKSKRHLSNLIKKLKNKNQLLKIELGSLLENNRTIAEREIETISKQSMLESEKSSIAEQLNLQIIKSKTYAEELVLLQNELDTLKSNSNHQSTTSDADLKNITALHDLLDQKTRNLHERALEVDRRSEDLEKNSRELEAQALEIDSLYCKLKEERKLLEEEYLSKKQENENIIKQSSEIEQQMAEIFQVKLYLENVKARIDEKETNIENKLLSIQSLETDLLIQQEKSDIFKTELLEKEVLLSSGLEIINQEKEELKNNKHYLESRILEIEQKELSLRNLENTFANREYEIEATRKSLEDAKNKIEDFKNVQDNKIKQTDSVEKNLAQMQEILRKRIEDIQLKESALNEKDTLLSNQIISLQTRNEEMENEHNNLVIQLTSARDDFEKSKQELLKKATDIDSVKFRMETENHGHELIKNEIFEALQRLEEEKAAIEEVQLANLEIEKLKLAQGIDFKNEISGICENIPDLMAGAENCLSRLLGARDLLQEHLREFHDYAKIAREELELLLKESRDQQNRSQDSESKIIKAREEHRLSIASFKQQLIEWQHNLIEIKLALQTGESELERKQAKFETQAQILQQQTDNLSKKEHNLREKEGEVLAQTKEVHRHLDDMRAWYRNKIKDLSGTISNSLASGYFDNALGRPDLNQDNRSQPTPDPIEPSDNKLGNQLISLGLVESDTLIALMSEAKQTRKSLRQALLNGGYLTFYQLALIEAGNINGLMIDRFRVIDKLPSTSKEYIFRVFDPIKKTECLLRHLSESELSDPYHPDEFRQRFSAAINLHHENVASTYEVLEIQGRPAVLIEFIKGINQSEWASIHQKPDVWLNLVLQSISGLASIHGAGLVYGPIYQSSLIITGEGCIKWIGAGSPTWLFSNESHEQNSFKNDVTNLAGQILQWLYNHEEKQNLKITSDNSFNDYILWIEEIASGKISVDLNEWVTKTALELQTSEDWESNYKNFIRLNLSENREQSLKLSA
ncbi:MAG: hypothetical protein NTV50_13795 [Planctomycetota bacterium]|nr:hypothetical protein [Planctomycetota bacterium]